MSENTPPWLENIREVYFVHLQNATLESVLPKLLLKTLQKGWKSCVWTKDEARMGEISDALWAVPHEWILPHGLADEPYPEQHPIWLSHEALSPNAPQAVFLCQGLWQMTREIPNSVIRVCLMIEPTEIDATKNARILWQLCSEGQRRLIKI